MANTDDGGQVFVMPPSFNPQNGMPEYPHFGVTLLDFNVSHIAAALVHHSLDPDVIATMSYDIGQAIISEKRKRGV